MVGDVDAEGLFVSPSDWGMALFVVVVIAVVVGIVECHRGGQRRESKRAIQHPLAAVHHRDQPIDWRLADIIAELVCGAERTGENADETS
jgi:hypothetical protein